MLTTPAKGIPYPEDADPVAAYPSITGALAQAVEDLLGVLPARMAAGKVDVEVSAATTGNAAVNFPAGRFTSPPVVVATSNGSTVWLAYAFGPTVNGVNVGVRQVQGTSTTATVPVHWVAVQV